MQCEWGQTATLRKSRLAHKLHVSRKPAIIAASEKRMIVLPNSVPASEFARNFGRYKLLAQRGAVAVSSNGTLAGYFVATHEYEELNRLKHMRRRFLTAELSDDEVNKIASARMDPRHDHLNQLLDADPE